MKYEGRGPSTSGITEIGNYGKPPRVEVYCFAMDLRKDGI